MTCKKAQGFLGSSTVSIKETVNATKIRYDSADALQLLTGIEHLIVTRGKKIERFNLKKDRPTDEELLARMMGPTGNLRAPTARIGKTLVVGFSEEAYQTVLGIAPGA